jgi:hypothetical protein
MPRRHTPYPRHRASAAGTTAGGSSSPTQPKSVDAFSTSTHPSVSMGAPASAHGFLLAPSYARACPYSAVTSCCVSTPAVRGNRASNASVTSLALPVFSFCSSL